MDVSNVLEIIEILLVKQYSNINISIFLTFLKENSIYLPIQLVFILRLG